MTPQEKAQEVAKLYQAFAEGKTLQFLSDSLNKWVDWSESASTDAPYIVGNNINKWRVKPEIKNVWYRLALMSGTYEKYCAIANSEMGEAELEKYPSFIKWLSNRIYVEIENEEAQ